MDSRSQPQGRAQQAQQSYSTALEHSQSLLPRQMLIPCPHIANTSTPTLTLSPLSLKNQNKLEKNFYDLLYPPTCTYLYQCSFWNLLEPLVSWIPYTLTYAWMPVSKYHPFMSSKPPSVKSFPTAHTHGYIHLLRKQTTSRSSPPTAPFLCPSTQKTCYFTIFISLPEWPPPLPQIASVEVAADFHVAQLDGQFPVLPSGHQ